MMDAAGTFRDLDKLIARMAITAAVVCLLAGAVCGGLVVWIATPAPRVNSLEERSPRCCCEPCIYELPCYCGTVDQDELFPAGVRR